MLDPRRLRPGTLLFGLLSLAMGPARPVLAVGYLPAPSVTVPGNGSDVATGDADGDGYDEVALAEPLLSSIGLLWNSAQATPSFGPRVDLALPFPAYKIAFADLDGNGLADLVAVGDSPETRLAVRLAGPGRTFGAPIVLTLPAGSLSGVRWVLAADVDRDGDLDLVAAEQASFAVLINHGDGSFDPARSDGAPGVMVTRLVAGEFGGGAGVDFLVVSDNRLEAWINNGSGAFARRPALATSVAGRSDVVAIDADRDGSADAQWVEPGAVRVYHNDGTGVFSAAAVIARPMVDTASRADDVNADGRLDLVAISSSGGLEVMYGDGRGSFAAPVLRALPNTPTFLALGDLNGDGERGDLAALAPTGDLALRVAAGKPTATSWASYPVAEDPRAIAIADLDGDGIADVAVADAGSRDISILLGVGGGALQPAGRFPVGGFPVALASADIDGDGLKDLVALAQNQRPKSSVLGAGTGQGELDVLRNLGGGVFGRPTTLAAGQGPMGLALGDLDGDGRPDAAVASGLTGEVLLFGNTGTGFGAPTRLAAGQGPVGVAIADLDGDGDLDVATATAGRVVVFENQGALGSWPTSGLAAGQGPIGIAALDLNLDGRADLAVLDGAAREVQLFVSDKTLALTASGMVAIPGEPRALAVGDLNCDAAEDLLVAADTGDGYGLLVSLSEGNGGTAPVEGLAAGQGPTGVAAGDLDGRGAEDPVVVIGADDQLHVGLNSVCALASCSVAVPAFGGAARGCTGQVLHLAGPPGFVRYRWSNGEEAPQIVLPLALEGASALSLRVLDASGCEASGEFLLLADPSPDVAITSDRTYACAGDTSAVRFALGADLGRAPQGLLGLDWRVDPPGQVLAPTAALTEVEFPAGTALGDYRANVTVYSSNGCSREVATVLHFVADAPSLEPVGNSLLLARDPSGGLALAWTPSAAPVHTVLRSDSKDPGKGGQVAVASGIEVPAWRDQPPAGVWFYRVQPGRVCSGLAGE